MQMSTEIDFVIHTGSITIKNFTIQYRLIGEHQRMYVNIKDVECHCSVGSWSHSDLHLPPQQERIKRCPTAIKSCAINCPAGGTGHGRSRGHCPVERDYYYFQPRYVFVRTCKAQKAYIYLNIGVEKDYLLFGSRQFPNAP